MTSNNNKNISYINSLFISSDRQTSGEYTVEYSNFLSLENSMNISLNYSMNTSLETFITKDNSPLTSASIIIRIILYTIIFIACILGNISVLLTLIFNKRLRNVTNCFLFNLAVSDLLLGVFCMPFTLIGSILKNFIFGPILCKMIPYFQAVSVGVSAWTLVAISMERYFAICHPLESRSWQTMSHSYRVIIMIWLANSLLLSPIAILSKTLPTKSPGKYKCREVWTSELTEELFNLILVLLLLFIPFIIMISTYTLVSRELFSAHVFQTKNINDYNSNNNQLSPQLSPNENTTSTTNGEYLTFQSTHSLSVSYDCKSGVISGILESNQEMNVRNNCRSKLLIDTDSNRKVTHVNKLRLGNSRRLTAHTLSKKRIIRMLYVLVFEFFICWTPVYVINIWALYWPKNMYTLISPTCISLIHLLSYLSSCTNPITYCFMHKKFRKALLTMIRNRSSSHRYVISELDHSTSNQSPSTASCNHSKSLSNNTLNTVHMYQYKKTNIKHQGNQGDKTNRLGVHYRSNFHIRNSVL